MEADQTGLIEQAILRAAVAGGLRLHRPDSRAADQQSRIAADLLDGWLTTRERDLSGKTGRADAR